MSDALIQSELSFVPQEHPIISRFASGLPTDPWIATQYWKIDSRQGPLDKMQKWLQTLFRHWDHHCKLVVDAQESG